MKIRKKIFIAIMGVAAGFFIFLAAVPGTIFRDSELKNAQNTAEMYSRQAADRISAQVNSDMAVVKTLASGLSGYNLIDAISRKKIYEHVLFKTLTENKRYLAVWVSWELGAVEVDYKKKHGRVRTIFLKNENRIDRQVDSLNLKGEDPKSLYYQIKTSKETEFVTDPYFFTYKSGKDSIPETSFAVKIITEDNFRGLAGIDVSLSGLQEIAEIEIPVEGGFVFLTSNNGSIIVHPNRKYVGKKINQLLESRQGIKLIEKIQNGELFSTEYFDVEKKNNYYSVFSPVKIGNARSPWSVCVAIPAEIIKKKADFYFNIILISAIIGFFLLSAVIFIISGSITKPMKSTVETLKKLESGDINVENKQTKIGKDEIGSIVLSLNRLIDTLNATAQYAVKIGRGEYDEPFVTNGNHDILGNSLNTLRDNLLNADKERKIREEEQEKRTLIREGIADVSEIIQRSYSDTDELNYRIISRIAKIVGAPQAGIFFTEKDSSGKRFLELKAAYAYDKKKRLETRFEFGESLVGRCALEKELIYLSDVPEGYSFINSGLGEDKPTALVLSPLIFEGTVYGVLEIASIKKFDTYQIEFIKSVSERVASVISSIQTSVETGKLLSQFQKQSEELASKEAEMLHTIEQMRDIQEISDMREQENKDIISAMMELAAVTFYDMDEKVIDINRKNFELFGTRKEEVIGKRHADLIPESKTNPETYKKFWDNLRQGIPQKKDYYLKKNEKELWLSETFTPIKDAEGSVIKVLCIGIDITKEKLLERELTKLSENR